MLVTCFIFKLKIIDKEEELIAYTSIKLILNLTGAPIYFHKQE